MSPETILNVSMVYSRSDLRRSAKSFSLLDAKEYWRRILKLTSNLIAYAANSCDQASWVCYVSMVNQMFTHNEP